MPMPPRRLVAALLAPLTAALVAAASGAGEPVPSPQAAKLRWADSPHGAMLARILPPGVEPAGLPQPGSDGARLLARYCVQCHHLPGPHMHTPERWRPIVERMVWRMQGRGNMGALMKDMMAGMEVPSPGEAQTLLAYLRRHGQAEIDPARYPDLDSRQGKLFSLACSQCHALPDPKRHAAKEWPKVVDRMQKHMAWTNRIVARSPDAPDELDVKSILAFLQRNSRAN